MGRQNKPAYLGSRRSTRSTAPAPDLPTPNAQLQEYAVDLDLGFNHNTLSPETSPNASLQELESRLLNLRSQVEMHDLQPFRQRPLSGSTCSSNTLKSNSDALQTVSEAQLAQWRFDVCRWIRSTHTKPQVLRRKNSTDKNGSPLFKLSRPAGVSELLGSHSDEQLIAEFMAQHESLERFEKYVMSEAHSLPKNPKVASISDQTTSHLPPLASEEYALHISRLSYLVRSLQAIEAVDPGFLSQTRVHLLLDLVLDLEHAFTLPRVDFLRQHAETIRAMDSSRDDVNTRDTDCVVGNNCLQGLPSADTRHVKYMTHAIPRHARFRRSSTTNTPSQATRDTCVLGNKLYPFYMEMSDIASNSSHAHTQSPSPKSSVSSSHAHTQSLSPKSSVSNSLDISQFDSTSQQHPAAYVAPTSLFDPKLHPVVRPQSMDVSPTLHVANANLSQTSSIQGKGLGSRRLQRRPIPGPQLSPATSGGFSAHIDS
ncbi:hypothetical protein IW139_001847 [Coemansia sp. RSA 353]|nr:hypothetical protein IW144_001930 [Coemansia sp. RSA 522]KAJ2290246.1 hypothetical protein IW141_003381 [Coemansia sp. RSA 355]KAJ2299214.1 hypothetical protein IW139_001847 [Coemansia sp. RSA 353]